MQTTMQMYHLMGDPAIKAAAAVLNTYHPIHMSILHKCLSILQACVGKSPDS